MSQHQQQNGNMIPKISVTSYQATASLATGTKYNNILGKLLSSMLGTCIWLITLFHIRRRLEETINFVQDIRENVQTIASVSPHHAGTTASTLSLSAGRRRSGAVAASSVLVTRNHALEFWICHPNGLLIPTLFIHRYPAELNRITSLCLTCPAI